MNNSTTIPSGKDIKRKWFVVDASGKTLGRLATTAASILAGKTSPLYTPYIDMGDHVVIINAEKIVLTGLKSDRSSIAATPASPVVSAKSPSSSCSPAAPRPSSSRPSRACFPSPSSDARWPPSSRSTRAASTRTSPSSPSRSSSRPTTHQKLQRPKFCFERAWL